MLFDAWDQLGRVIVAGVLAYTLLLLVLRVSGKRTLAKLNAFDLVVTVALGSALASTFLSSDVAVAEGALAFAVLAVVQLAVARVTVRSARMRRLVKSTPTLLVARGRLLESHLTEQRIAVEEVRQAVRATGSGDLSQVAAVVLETDGTLSVIPSNALGDGSALVDLDGVEDLVADRS